MNQPQQKPNGEPLNLSPEQKNLLARYRALPEAERNQIIADANKLVLEAMREFYNAVQTLDTDFQTKEEVIAFVWGPVGQTEEEALKDNSKFSRSYTIGLFGAVMEIMKERR